MNSLEHGVLKIVLELEQFVNTKNSTLTTSEKRSVVTVRGKGGMTIEELF